MFKVENRVLTINYLEKKIAELSSQDVNRWQSMQYLLVYYFRILVGPVVANLAVMALVGVSIYKGSEPYQIMFIVGLYLMLPLIPLSTIIRISFAARKGRKDAEEGKDSSNPFRPDSYFFKAYDYGYNEARSKEQS